MKKKGGKYEDRHKVECYVQIKGDTFARQKGDISASQETPKTSTSLGREMAYICPYHPQQELTLPTP